MSKRRQIENGIVEGYAAGRADGLEAAALKAETFFDWCEPIGEHANMKLAQEFASECAAGIRALAETEKPE